MASLDEMSDVAEDGRAFEIATDGPSPLEQFELREDRAEVAEVLLKLKPNYREVLVLRFHEELSLEEIAERDSRAALDGEVAAVSRAGRAEAGD